MFIKEFPTDKKRTILDLGIYAAKSDDVFTDEEKAVIDRLTEEMELGKGYDPVSSLDATLFVLNREFTEEDKKKIFIEIVAVVASDVITPKEEQFLRSLQKQLNIPEDKYELAMSVAKDYLRVDRVISKYFE